MSNITRLTSGSQKELRRVNRNRVFRTLFSASQAITRQEICQSTGLNLPLVSRIITELLGADLLEEVISSSTLERRGRRCTALQIHAEGAYVISVAITAYSQEILVGNMKGHILYNKTLPGIFALPPQELITFLADSIEDALQATRIPRERVLGGSMALPRQMLLPGSSASSLSFLGSALREKLEQKLSIPLVSIRLAEVLNLAEVTWGASRGYKNVVCVHLTSLVGASLLHAGALLPPPDTIGNISCLPIARAGKSMDLLPRIENMASGMSILQRLGFLSPDSQLSNYSIEDTLNLALVHSRSLTGDSATIAAFSDAGEWMGHALETLYHAYQPEIFILSGSLIENPYYLKALEAAWEGLYPSGTPAALRLGTMSIGSAAILTALEMFTAMPTLDLEPLLGGAA